MLLHGSTLLADEFELHGDELWDRSCELAKKIGPLGFLMQKAAIEGVSLPSEVLAGSTLAGLLIDAIGQAA